MAIAEEWYNDLPHDIRDRAYNFHGELAWARPDAAWIIAFLQDHDYRVTGIDTWLPTRPGPTPLIDDWENARGMPALAFVQAFAWKPIDEADRSLEVHFAIMARREPGARLTGEIIR